MIFQSQGQRSWGLPLHEEGCLWKVLLGGLFAPSSPAWRGATAPSDYSGDDGGAVVPSFHKEVTLSAVPPPQLGSDSPPGTLTPSDEEEEPLPQALGGVGHDDGRVQVATLHEHPEEVRHHEVVEDGGDAAAPDLQGRAAVRGCPGQGPRVGLGAGAGRLPAAAQRHGLKCPEISFWEGSSSVISLCFRLS